MPAWAATDARIIPARAGFTVHRHGIIILPRIIPARAGFTLRKTITMCMVRDHPRSRGVYPGTTPYS